MSKFREQREQLKENKGEEVAFEGKTFNVTPELLEALRGYRLPNGTNRPGCKITVWVDGPRTKVCFTDNATKSVGFATLDPDLPLAEAIEDVIVNLKVEWKDNKYAK